MTITHKIKVPLVIISPVRDESALIRLTLDSVVAQSVVPLEWIIVDDGSVDNTAEIVSSYASKYEFIKLVKNENRGFRKLGGGVIAAFDFGASCISDNDYEFIAKLDGDMSFGEKYIEIMLEKLNSNVRLAAVSGKVVRPEGDSFVKEWIIDEHVAGQFKIYRRSAFDEIGGFVQEVMWDGIDVHMSRMKGWDTLSFENSDALLIHHRLMGSSDKNVLRGRVRWGKGIWFMGYHPLYAIASGVFRMSEKPVVLGGLLIIYGYFYGLLGRKAQYAYPGFRDYLQSWQLKRLKSMFFG